MNRTELLTRYAAVAVVLVAGRVLAVDPAEKQARVTQIIQDVKLLKSGTETRPAAIDDRVAQDTAVRTGDQSRSELTFVDLTITRLGASE